MNSRKRIAAIDHFWEPTLVKTRTYQTAIGKERTSVPRKWKKKSFVRAVNRFLVLTLPLKKRKSTGGSYRHEY
jgi:hypothetical protein